MENIIHLNFLSVITVIYRIQWIEAGRDAEGGVAAKPVDGEG